MSPGQAQNLVGALRSQSAPGNPKTPNPDERRDPSEKRILDLQRIRRSLEIAMEPDHLADGDPLKALLSVMHGAITRLRDGVDTAAVVQTMTIGIGQMAQQLSPQPMAGAAGLPGPAATAGPQPGAPPMGMPPQPGPVSPPIPGG